MKKNLLLIFSILFLFNSEISNASECSYLDFNIKKELTKEKDFDK